MTILTATVETNADLFPKALSMYVRPGARIADVTYGRGVFWRNVDESIYDLVKSDAELDLCHLPYENDSFDAVVLDPPYMNGGGGVKDSVERCYKNGGGNGSHQAVMALYFSGILEARRILRKGGVLFVKCQPAIADHKQKPTHVWIWEFMPVIGIRIEDEFLLVQTTVPLMRHRGQQHARKNHSYLIVGRYVR